MLRVDRAFSCAFLHNSSIWEAMSPSNWNTLISLFESSGTFIVRLTPSPFRTVSKLVRLIETAFLLLCPKMESRNLVVLATLSTCFCLLFWSPDHHLQRSGCLNICYSQHFWSKWPFNCLLLMHKHFIADCNVFLSSFSSFIKILLLLFSSCRGTPLLASFLYLLRNQRLEGALSIFFC